jgi:hypothetical protein
MTQAAGLAGMAGGAGDAGNSRMGGEVFQSIAGSRRSATDPFDLVANPVPVGIVEDRAPETKRHPG